jgi:hypothetical protein
MDLPGGIRWNYVRTPGHLGYDETKLGLPSYMGQISSLNNVPNSTTLPVLELDNPTINVPNAGYIFSVNNDYQIAPSIMKTWKTHTFKAGADVRLYEQKYFQSNSPGGFFDFNTFMSSSANNAAGGYPFASFLMGYMTNQAVNASWVQIAPVTHTGLVYQGYYLVDNWVLNHKLTVNLGVRYDIPGEYRETNNLMATFNPNETNSALGAMTINGRAITGAFDLVDSPQHPESGLHSEHYTDFSPRLGIAYRLDGNTVIRGGWGSLFLPADLLFPESPVQSPLAYIQDSVVATLNSGVTPNATLDNPLPRGITPAPLRSASYQQLLLGGSGAALSEDEDSAVAYQWNVAVQRQLPKELVIEVSYAGSHGVHLPFFYLDRNQISPTYLAQAQADSNCVGPSADLVNKCFLTKTVPNPFNTSLFSQGPQQSPTISSGQLYAPFPQYGGIAYNGRNVGRSNYDALEVKAEKRFPGGGVLLGSYTFSKFLTNADSWTFWLETNGAAWPQNYYDIQKGEYSLSAYDSRQRLSVAYVYALPFGHGHTFGSGASGIAGGLISGWGVNGVTTLQDGFPLGLDMVNNTVATYSLQGNTRPNRVAGCNVRTSGPIQSRLGDAYSKTTDFNPSCYVAPGTFQFGTNPREDATLRGPGIANWDFALYKDTHLSDRMVLQLRFESFNLFNRVQFGPPNQSIGSAQVGEITSQANSSRELQLAGRINF